MRAVLTALVILSAATPTEAQPRTEAKKLFESATRAYDMGQYEDAAATFRRVFELTGSAEVLFNIGQAYRLGKRYDEALLFYRSFLRRVPGAASRPDVERRITEIEEMVARQRHEAGAPPVGLSPSPPADAPAVDEPAHTPAVLPAPPVIVPAPLAPSSAPAARRARVAGYVLVAVAGVAAVSGGALLGVAEATAGSLEASARQHQPYDLAAQDRERLGQTQSNVGLGLLIGAGLVAVVGVAAIVVGHRSRPERVTVAPSLSPSHLGVVLVGSF